MTAANITAIVNRAMVGEFQYHPVELWLELAEDLSTLLSLIRVLFMIYGCDMLMDGHFLSCR